MPRPRRRTKAQPQPAKILADPEITTVVNQPHSDTLTDGRKRLTHRDIALILKLAEAGKMGKEIAGVIGVSEATVSRTLTEWADTREIARRYLDRSALQVAERAAVESEPLAVLERIGVVEGPKSQGPSVAVLIGGQSQPLSPPQIVIASETLPKD